MAQKSKQINKLLKIGVIVLSGAVFLLAAIFIKNRPTVKATGVVHNIVLTNDGFEPSEITIKLGDSIKFSTTRGKDYWPASDLHPSHEIYSDFDPKRPLASDETWSFTFDREGKWKFHDHLFSFYRGEITVLKNDNQVFLFDCDGFEGEKLKCFEKQLDDTLNKIGIDAAFDMIAEFYAKDSVFAASCHDFTHKVGKAAYGKFVRENNIDLTAKMYYCGYGFYHGFMEELLQTTNDIEQARRFCAYAGEQLKKETTDAEGACYHGIGHGAVDGSDPTAWGNPGKMMKPGIDLCSLVSRNDAEEYRCITGVFNAIEILSQDNKYKLEALRDNPFSLCDDQPQKWREACYTNVSFIMTFQSTQGDIKKTSSILISKIKNDPNNSIKISVLGALFHEFMRINFNDQDYPKKAIELCRSINETYRLACFEGISGGHMKHGEPDQEYVKAIKFSSLASLKSDEKNVCFRHFLTRLRIWYSQEEAKMICKDIPREYQTYCNVYN